MAQEQHKLKILKEYYSAVIQGRKTFEIRKNDRAFKVNDWLILQPWSGSTYIKTPNIRAQISYITDYKQKKDYIVMGLRNVDYEHPV